MDWSKLKKISRIFLKIFFAFTIIFIVITIFLYLKEEKYLFFGTGTNIKAFMNATWEMSEKEVKRSNNCELEKCFFPFEKTLAKNVFNSARFKSLGSHNVNLWGYEAYVSYHFFDDKLFGYDIFAKIDCTKIVDSLVIANIGNKYGSIERINSNNYKIYEGKWDSRYVKIYYFIDYIDLSDFEEDGKKMKGIANHLELSFIYKPIEKKIQEIGSKEQNSIF